MYIGLGLGSRVRVRAVTLYTCVGNGLAMYLNCTYVHQLMCTLNFLPSRNVYSHAVFAFSIPRLLPHTPQCKSPRLPPSIPSPSYRDVFAFRILKLAHNCQHIATLVVVFGIASEPRCRAPPPSQHHCSQ